ncbi:MAG TPA: apolipoprotein N-acyltransferase [Prolixibacteraceae bacterium]|nr:apolipoprotein N-acyltransferase [Prolixibacteraceae bacterium]
MVKKREISNNKNKALILIALSVLSGVLLAISAIPSKVWFLNFVALVPLLFAAEATLKKKKPLLLFALQILIFLVVFYLWVGHWVLEAANLGFLIGFVLVIPFLLLLSPYVLFLKKQRKLAPVYFIVAWLTAELIQNYFELGTPFYNLGHSLGIAPKLIQWYEYTGAAGGTLWILCINFLLFSLTKTIVKKQKVVVKKAVALAAVVIIPILVSLLIFNTYNEKGTKSEVLVIHPSTDNSDVKYRLNIYELMDIYLDIMLPALSENTEYVVLPETAITNAGWVSEYNRNLVFQHFREKTANYPNLKLITGAITYENIPDVEKIKNYKKIPSIHYSEKYLTWYYTYNAALQISHTQPTQIRVKEGLVPYQEYAPYSKALPYISPVGIDFQFSRRENNRNVFINEKKQKVAALICYEVVYGKIFSKAARQGAEAFFVLLNEGWYNDPKVPRQFLQLSVIRAIENRRSIAHSSNLGVSAFINQKGEIVEQTDSKQPGFLKQEILLNKSKTFASAMGNYLGIIALAASVLIICRELLKKKSIVINIPKIES